MSKFAIEVQGLTKSFNGKLAVDQLDLSIPEGIICGFLGPNGSGKTTTIRMICGLLKADAGQGTCLGFDLFKETRNIRKNIGYMTQKFSGYHDLTVRENLSFISRLFSIQNREETIDQTLEKFALTTRQNQLAGYLSGGLKQRLALACCLIHQPKLVLLDEPTASVDPSARRNFWEILYQTAAQGVTILVSTHYMDEANRCQELIYLSNGRVLAQGSQQQILHSANIFIWNIYSQQIDYAYKILKKIPLIQNISIFDQTLQISSKHPKAGDLTQMILHKEGIFATVTSHPFNLEDAYVHLIAQPQKIYL